MTPLVWGLLVALLALAALNAVAVRRRWRHADADDGSARGDLRGRAHYPVLGTRNKALVHGAISAVVCVLFYLLGAEPLTAAGLTVLAGPGVAWEASQGVFRPGDLLGDVAGAVVVLAVLSVR